MVYMAPALQHQMGVNSLKEENGLLGKSYWQGFKLDVKGEKNNNEGTDSFSVSCDRTRNN